MSAPFEPEEIIDPGRAVALAKDLNGGRRRRPSVVVSHGAEGPRVDARRIASELGDLAHVHVLTNLESSSAFCAAMPAQVQVYGGAARVYPAGLEWVHDPGRAPLRFAHSAAQGDDVTTRLIEDGLAAAARIGPLTSSQPPANEVIATVRGCPTASQAMVDIDGTYATIQVGLIAPELTSDRVFAPGMQIRGILNAQTHQLDVTRSVPDPVSRLAEVREGDVIWARVESVGARHCELAPYPGVLIRVPWNGMATNATDDLHDLLSPGEVIAARAGWNGDGRLELSLDDLDHPDDAHTPRDALAIFAGGPPWLVPPAIITTKDQPPVVPARDQAPAKPSPLGAIPAQSRPQRSVPHAPVRPSPVLLASRSQTAGLAPAPPAAAVTTSSSTVRSMSLQLDAARARVSQLETEIRSQERRLRATAAEMQLLEQELGDQARELDTRETELIRLKGRLRKEIQEERRTGQRIGVHGGELFLSLEEQFRFDVHLRWALRIPAAEKSERPLRPYTLGRPFLGSLGSIQGVDHFKVVDVVVEVLTGLADTSAGRQMHALRSGPGGDDDTLRRGEYTCWRIAIQRHTPQARRLHFWRSADDIELSRVVLHDDFAP